jgi:hypothetical protein
MYGPRVLLLSSGTVGVGLLLSLEHGGHHASNDWGSNWSEMLTYCMQIIDKHQLVISKGFLRHCPNLLMKRVMSYSWFPIMRRVSLVLVIAPEMIGISSILVRFLGDFTRCKRSGGGKHGLPLWMHNWWCHCVSVHGINHISLVMIGSCDNEVISVHFIMSIYRKSW